MKNIFLVSSITATHKGVFEHIDRDMGKNVLFISTAAELEDGERKWLKDEKAVFKEADFNVANYTLTGKSEKRLTADVALADIIFVAGGNPFYLLQQIHSTNFKSAVHKHLADGKIYIGESSGMLVASPNIEVAYRPQALDQVPELDSYNALDIVDFIGFPHWGSEMSRENYLEHRIKKAYVDNNKIILLSNSQYIVVDNGWYKIFDVKD